MHGIHAAFEGRLGRDAELRATKKGKPWLAASIAVDTEGEEGALTATWVRVAYFGEDAESLIGRLQRGAEMYCEGRLRHLNRQGWLEAERPFHSGLEGCAFRANWQEAARGSP